jgi:hypothetical protein
MKGRNAKDEQEIKERLNGAEGRARNAGKKYVLEEKQR